MRRRSESTQNSFPTSLSMARATGFPRPLKNRTSRSVPSSAARSIFGERSSRLVKYMYLQNRAGTTTAGFWVVQWQLLFSSLNICRLHSSTTQWPRDYCAKGSLQLLLQTSGPAPPSCDGLQELHQDQNQQREQITGAEQLESSWEESIKPWGGFQSWSSARLLEPLQTTESKLRLPAQNQSTPVPDYSDNWVIWYRRTLVPDYSVTWLLDKRPSVSRNISSSLLHLSLYVHEKLNRKSTTFPRMHCGITELQTLVYLTTLHVENWINLQQFKSIWDQFSNCGFFSMATEAEAHG